MQKNRAGADNFTSEAKKSTSSIESIMSRHKKRGAKATRKKRKSCQTKCELIQPNQVRRVNMQEPGPKMFSQDLSQSQILKKNNHYYNKKEKRRSNTKKYKYKVNERIDSPANSSLKQSPPLFS